MELFGHNLLTIIEIGGIFAPLFFIILHLIRPIFFIPVILVCVSGGAVFGVVFGSLYSLIGVTLSSLTFYVVINWMPKTLQRMMKIKRRLAGEYHDFSVSQITILRLIPFINYHLLSLCLIDSTADFKEYTKASITTNIPFVIVYTAIGQWIAKLSPLYMAACFMVLIFILLWLRRKEMVIKWQDFFQVST